MPFLERKINPFEAVNRKNNFKELLDSLNGGNWRVPGEEMTLCLTYYQNARRKGH